MKKFILAAVAIVVAIVGIFMVINFVSDDKIDVSNSKAEEFLETDKESKVDGTEVIDSTDSSVSDESTGVSESETVTNEETRKAEELWSGYGIRNDDFNVTKVLSEYKSNFTDTGVDSEDGFIFSPGTQEEPCVYTMQENSSYSYRELEDAYDENLPMLYNAVVDYFGTAEPLNVLTEYLDIYVHSDVNGYFIYDFKATSDAFYVVIMRGKNYYHFAIVEDDGKYVLLNYVTKDYFESSFIKDIQDTDNDAGED